MLLRLTFKQFHVLTCADCAFPFSRILLPSVVGDHPAPSKISFKRGTKSDVVAVACTSESKIFKSVALRPRRHLDGHER